MEFPIPLAHGRGAVGGGGFPEEGLGAFAALAEPDGGDVLTIDVIRDFRDAGDAAKRRQPIGEGEHAVLVHPPRLHPAGPADDEWHAHAALVLLVLAAAVFAGISKHVVGEFPWLLFPEHHRSRAVVAGEDNDGVPAEAEFFQLGEHAADIAVQRKDVAEVLPHGFIEIAADFHALVELVLGGFRKVRALHFHRGEFGGQARGHMDGKVGAVRPDVHVERLFRLGAFADEAEGGGEEIRIAAFGILVAAAHDADLVDAVGARLGFRADVPFPEMAGAVALALEQPGDGLVAREAEVRGVLGIACREAPCHQASAAGVASHARDVGLGEARPFRRELVNVWRLRVGVPVAGRIAPAEVVGENEDDVRRRSLRCGGSTGRKEAKAGEEAGGGMLEGVHSFPGGGFHWNTGRHVSLRHQAIARSSIPGRHRICRRTPGAGMISSSGLRSSPSSLRWIAGSLRSAWIAAIASDVGLDLAVALALVA